MNQKIPPQKFGSGMTVPMPKIYVPDEDFIGKKVTLHMCEYHEDCDPAEGWARKDVSLTGNCNCSLKGKEITITGTQQTSRANFYRSICYTVAESPNLINEVEFSEESKEKQEKTTGYILEGKKGNYLHFDYKYYPHTHLLDGYLFNTGLIKIMMKKGIEAGTPTRAYRGRYNWDGSDKWITDKSIGWEELKKKILV